MQIGPKKYKQGMVFRCDPDGSHVECLGQNFRNPYEVAVDSYGTFGKVIMMMMVTGACASIM